MMNHKKESKKSAGRILQMFLHVMEMNHRLCRWILPCNLLKNVIYAAVPYIGIVYGCDILNGLTSGRPQSEIMDAVYHLVFLTFAMTLVFHILDKLGNALRDSIRYRMQRDVADKAVRLDYQDLEKQETMQILAAALEGEKESGGVYWFSDKLGTLLGDAASIVYAFIVLLPVLATSGGETENGFAWIVQSQGVIYFIFLLNLLSMIVFLRISRKGNERQYRLYEESLDAVRKDSYFYREILSKYQTGKEIRIYGLKDLLMRDMTAVWQEKCDIQARKMALQEKVSIQYQAVQAILLAFSYVVIGVRGTSGMITGADVVKYVSALTALGGACRYMIEHFETVLLNMQYLHHYYEYLHLPNRKETGTVSTKDLAGQELTFTLEHVSFRYPGVEEYSLRDVNLTLHYGEKIALVGPNGAGKTTLILLLCRLYEPTQGRILLNGRDIREYDYREYQNLFGVVFQDFQLFAMNVAENVAAADTYEEKRVWECLDKAGVGERVREMEQGVQTQLYNVGKKGVEVSGGEAQKIAIARALYKDAPCIILDEPTSALDPVAEYEIYAGFDQLVAKNLAVYISHRMSSCRFCERILVLEQGRIAEEGNHEALLAKNGIYARMWNLQAKNYQ
jgi:ATP-binding cassette subfamily B protein